MASHYESQVGIILTTNHISIIGIFVVAKAKYFLILHFKDSFMISCLHLPFLFIFSERLGSMVTTLGLNYVIFHYSLKVYTVVKFQKVNFTSIHSSGTGTCLYALSDVRDNSSSRNDYVKVIKENITAEKDIQNLEFEHSYRISLFGVQSIGVVFS